MSETITITWTVEDGYVGHRPFKVKVDIDEFQHCESAGDIEQLLNDIVRDEFEQKVSWSICNEHDLIGHIRNLKDGK